MSAQPGVRHALVPAALALVLALTGCPAPSPGGPTAAPTAPPPYACPPGDLLLEANATDTPLFQAQTIDYSTTCRNAARLTVSTARDAGTTSFVNGLVHIAAADSALDSEQAEQASVRCLRNPARHLPVAVDPVALIYRLDGVDTLTLRPATLAKIFSGVITRWNDPEIVADNPDATLPDARIEVVPRSHRTGLTEAVGEWLHREAPDHWPTGPSQSWRGQGVVRGSAQETLDAVRTTPYSLAYVEFSQLPRAVVSPTPTPSPTASPSPTPTPSATAVPSPGASGSPTPSPPPPTGDIRLARLALAGGPVELTRATATTAVNEMAPRADGPDLVIDAASLSRAPGGWPIQRVSYQVLCSAGLSPEITALERDWVGYLVDDPVQQSLPDQGRIPLPPPLRERVRASAAEVR